MWYEIVRWISIGLCWIATALNVYGFVKNFRNSRKLSDLQKHYIEALQDLTNPKE